MLSSFPRLAASDFDEACNSLLGRYRRAGQKQEEWLSIETVYHYDMTYLSITKALPDAVYIPKDSNDDDEVDEVEEDDEEVIAKSSVPQAIINYDIVLSPTYQVPVLYISISDPQHRFPPTMATLYEHLIPLHFKTQTEHAGVIGGITVTDHPATNRPVFFIHPCQTAGVIEASVGARDVTAEEYLMVWIGALGKCVGLNIPLALVREEEDDLV
ncbi:uncharacterized protein K460DRAFT_282638 [Cucurbitaria berberidis CBS 394.84]|uniref:Ubiquitin-like-conjugating enzyme ATG10 n=1 Tax=Cucurbitaria berberidis CBS 394.84 TaxID=1168544 RepID=A0A9P4L950_9PLEO|nr:uncharacterized protein K460DRAFT_282638 [Cucurbitaria berberidis CBS 394.84]KAF1845854.1 hypothetical protein K460DRAFT_282638 [Cucurbitaria berberidis CBS 394.84]